jgi:uncharacterized membrane protein/osmotically-inducible protein OsmY
LALEVVMSQRALLLGGIGLGAGFMFLFDPRSGRRRRGEARGKAVHGAHQAARGAGTMVRDLGHRSRGLLARVRGVWGRRAPDEIVEERVRSALGHVCSHPGAIEVMVSDGRVRITGDILAEERAPMLNALRHVHGVEAIEDRLQAHERAAGVPGLQGGRPRARRRPPLGPTWAPATRLIAGLASSGLVVAGVRRGRGLGWAAGAAGGLLLARSLADRPLWRLFASGEGMEVRKTIHVRAPADQVFALWSNLESFPRFMSHVRDVRRTDDGLYRWKVGPFSWLAEVTTVEPNRALAWRSLRGSSVDNAGIVRFRADDHGGTQIDLRLSYFPPGGSLGRGLAHLFGFDPKRHIDEDLLRFKSLLEQGKATGQRETVTREEIGEGPGLEPPRIR